MCSGIEAATVAWHPLGWEPAFFSEIEAFPRAVLTHHYPETPLHGDFTTIGADDYGTIQLLVGGTPCQSFSISGLRKGMDDDRGNLALEYLKLAQRKRPTWLVWENVPGVLSSNGGRDFGAFLGGLGELGYGFAYRVLDAQYFGVAQRRRRVFVVGYLGDWRPPAAVLFERQSLQGHPAPSREKREKSAKGTECRTFAGNQESEVAGTLNTTLDDYSRADSAFNVVTQYGNELAGSLTARHDSSPCADRGQNCIAFKPGSSADSRSIGAQEEVACTLEAGGGVNNRQAVAFTQNQRDELRTVDVPGALSAQPGMKQQTYIAESIGCSEELTASTELAGTLQRGGEGGRHDGVMQPNMAVRRLTPVECCRLQGFPDNYTKIPYRKKTADNCPDGPRYKAIGNSMAVPVMRWIGQRIQAVQDILTEEKGIAIVVGMNADMKTPFKEQADE